MGKRGSPWQGGRRAWERLNGWHQDGPAASPGHPDDGDAALEALGDVGHVRNLLNQAELVAVRTARRHGKSWAEIAVKLGVTRQSAWERWRDLDESTVAEPATGKPAEDRTVGPAATVRVPGAIGMPTREAQQLMQSAGLFAVGPNLDGPPLTALEWPHGVVTDQAPEEGAKVPPGSTVTLWVERGGGFGGVREPRRPKPGPRSAREMRQEPSDEAVG